MIIKFLKTIFLVDLLKGLWITLKYTPQPAFTFQDPAERRPVAPRFRGVRGGKRLVRRAGHCRSDHRDDFLSGHAMRTFGD